MTTMDPKAAMRDLMSASCACGAKKDRRRPFCLPCFQSLPRALRSRLAGIGKSEYPPSDYPAIYAAALAALDLESQPVIAI